MTMIDIFKETIKELPVELTIKTVKESYGKWKLTVKLGDDETTVELRKTCSPGEERNYCWQVAATAISTVFFYREDYKRAKLWLDAMSDRSIITAENA